MMGKGSANGRSRVSGNGTGAPLGPVAYVLRKFPVLSETFVLNEMLGLEARGVPLHVFSLMRPNDPRFHDDLPKLRARVAYVPEVGGWKKLLGHNRRLSDRMGARYTKAVRYAVSCGKPELLWRVMQAGYVANEALRLKVRHLHAQFANRPTTVAMLASRMTGIPFSFTAHATDIFKHRVDRKALARKIGASAFTVTVSEYNQRFLREIAPEHAYKIVQVPNGIDLERFSANGTPPLEPFRIIAVARLVEKKGLSDLIEGCRLLRDRGLDFTCRIVGKGRLRSQLERQIRDAKLEKHVELVGPKTQLEVLREFHGAHLYVLPAIVGSDGNREGLPVSIVEALACGLPVVSTPVTGIPEAVAHGRNGLLVPERDAPALAAALESLITDHSRWEELRGEARASVEDQFDRRRTIERLHDLIEQAAPA